MLQGLLGAICILALTGSMLVVQYFGEKGRCDAILWLCGFLGGVASALCAILIVLL